MVKREYNLYSEENILLIIVMIH